MYDFRTEILTLAEKALRCFVRFRINDLGIKDTWTVGLKSFVETNYPWHEANYKKLHVYFQTHDETELVLEQLDITALTTLILYYSGFKDLLNISADTIQFFKNHVYGISDLRNIYKHYPETLAESDASMLYYDQLYFTEGLSSFAVLVMKHKSPSDEWKMIYHSARQIIARLHGEHWLALDDKEKVLKTDDDMSTVLALADQGNIDAQVQAGKAFFHGIRSQFDPEKAYMWFYKAAKKGNPEAEYYLGKCFENAFGVPFDYEAAMSWFKKSAEQGFAAAQCEYGCRNWAKIGITPEELDEIVHWLKLSADQEYPPAQWTLGLCYMIGHGVKKDIILGMELKEKSAENGYSYASKSLAEEAERKGDFEGALKWYIMASNQGEPDLENKIKRIKRKIEDAISHV